MEGSCMDDQRLDLGVFETEEYRSEVKKHERLVYGIKKFRPVKRKFAPKKKLWKEKENYGYSMLAKLGLCAVAGAFVLIGNAHTTENAALAVSAQQEREEEEPGRLHFVELPGLLSVFGGDGKYELPAACDRVSLLEEKTLLCMNSSLSQRVEAPDTGRIKTVGLDENYGTYVSILTGDDREIQVYGLFNVSVEEGQSVLKGDTLGYTEADADLYVKLYKTGRLEELDAYFRLEVLS